MDTKITKAVLEEALGYVFINNNTDYNLYITHTEDILCFKFNNLTTGLEGFKNIYKEGITLGVENIYYNGNLLNEEKRKEIFNKLLK